MAAACDMLACPFHRIHQAEDELPAGASRCLPTVRAKCVATRWQEQEQERVNELEAGTG
jgi:hypothetical protein